MLRRIRRNPERAQGAAHQRGKRRTGDVAADLAVWDFKGGRNLTMLSRVAVASGHGRSDDTVCAFRDYLAHVLTVEGPARAEVFNRLPAALVHS